MITELNRLGCQLEPCYDSNGLLDGFTSVGRQRPAGGTILRSGGDHRVFMSLAIAALGAESPSLVEGVENIHVGFPDFLEALAALGIRCAPIGSEATLYDVSAGEA